MLKTQINLTNKLNKVGITCDNFVQDGHFLELMLLSAIRADGLSNLGYEYTDAFILKMGACTINSVFGYVQISDNLKRLFKLSSPMLKLKECNFKYGQLSVLFNLLHNIGIDAENILCFDVNYFTDISPSVSFTINRTPKYIRNLKEVLEKCLDLDEFVHLKGKTSEICNETQAEINNKIDFIRQSMGNSGGSDLYGNIYTNVSLGSDGGMNFYVSDNDCLHMESSVSVNDKSSEYKPFGDIRVSILNLGYNKIFKIEDIYGSDENDRLLLQMQEDMRAGINFMLGVIDGWSSVRNNRLSVFS